MSNKLIVKKINNARMPKLRAYVYGDYKYCIIYDKDTKEHMLDTMGNQLTSKELLRLGKILGEFDNDLHDG